EAETARNFGETFFEPFFETIRYFPKVKFIKTIGDEIICVCENPENNEDIRFAETLSRNLINAGKRSHIGIGRGKYTITKTPYGKVVVEGPASDQALSAQDGHKKHGGDVSIYLDNGQKTEGYPTPESVTLGEPPPSAIHFFKNTRPPNDMTRLIDEVKKQMAVVASTITPAAVQLEEPTERRATSIYIKTPAKSGDTILTWERYLESLADQFDAKVLHIEIEKGEKRAIVILGAQGSSPFKQEERLARFVNRLTEELGEVLQIGTESGRILTPDTLTADISDAINVTARLGHATTANIPEGIDIGERTMGRIRIGRNAKERLETARISPRGIKIEGPLNLRRIGVHQVTTCDSFELPETPPFTASESEVINLVETISTLTAGKHIHLEGETGVGKHSILRETAIRTNKYMIVTDEYQEDIPFRGISEILRKLFPSKEDFESWMEKMGIAANQQKIWASIYKELAEKSKIPTEPTTVENELTTILNLIENLGIACPNIHKMDEYSQKILYRARIILISTGKTGNTCDTFKIRGVTSEEITSTIQNILQIETEPDIHLINYIQREIPETNGRRNPTLVRALLSDLLKASAINKGSAAFDESKAAEITVRATMTEFQEGIVREKTQEVEKSEPARKLLKILVAIGAECSIKELAKIAGTNITVPLRMLYRNEILEPGPPPLRFKNSFFAQTAIALDNLKPTPNEIDEIEINARTGTDTPEKYVQICERLDLTSRPAVIETVISHVKTLTAKGELTRATYLLERFLKSIREPQDPSQILDAYLLLIENNLTIGRDNKEALSRAASLPQSQAQKIALLKLTCKVHYANKDINLATASLEKLSREVPESDIELRIYTASLHFHKSDEVPPNERIKEIDASIAILESINSEEITDEKLKEEFATLKLLTRGYKLLRGLLKEGDLGDKTREQALSEYEDELKTNLEETPAEKRKQKSYIERALYLPRTGITRASIGGKIEPERLDGIIQFTRELIETASENGYFGLELQGRVFLINFLHLGGTLLNNMELFRRGEDEYQNTVEMIGSISPDEIRFTAQKILFMHATRLEIIIENLKHSRNEERTINIVRGHETVKTISDYFTTHPELETFRVYVDPIIQGFQESL
ncbi:MAG: hypothetical protein UW03_C0003G0001, partial [Candidatus Peregrinibacteria bacterium GW2011_GWA2_43_8]